MQRLLGIKIVIPWIGIFGTIFMCFLGKVFVHEHFLVLLCNYIMTLPILLLEKQLIHKLLELIEVYLKVIDGYVIKPNRI